MTKYFFLVIFAILHLIGCNHSGDPNSGNDKLSKAKIQGKISNGVGKKIYLQQIKPNNLIMLDSAVVNRKGSFEITSSLNYPGLYFLLTESGSSIILGLKGGEKVNISADYNNFIYYNISGSVDSEELRLLAQKTNTAFTRIGELAKISKDSIVSPNYSSIKMKINDDFFSILNDLRSFSRDFIKKNQTSLICLIALKNEIGPNMHVLHPANDMALFQYVDSVLMSRYPQSDLVVSLHNELETYLAQNEINASSQSGLTIGEKAPEIALPSPGGQIIKLSSLRGKIVLLDFWAAWCPPCRAENPNLVSNYEKYRSKGFEIYQVSLDREKDAWINAIREDKLNWLHVSDLKQWESGIVSDFRINSIPANYLLDKDGNIVASNLRGTILTTKLEEIFNP